MPVGRSLTASYPPIGLPSGLPLALDALNPIPVKNNCSFGFPLLDCAEFSLRAPQGCRYSLLPDHLCGPIQLMCQHKHHQVITTYYYPYDNVINVYCNPSPVLLLVHHRILIPWGNYESDLALDSRFRRDIKLYWKFKSSITER